MYSEFSVLMGETLVSVQGAEAGADEVLFETDKGRRFRMYHRQDCCEAVYLAEVVGDVADLIGSPILQAEEAISDGEEDADGSSTWTFYKLATIKGSVTLRWYGESNGYYSQDVTFEEEGPEEE